MLKRSRNPGWIEVICGPMFSGKSLELIARVRVAQIAQQTVQVFKPIIDDRYVIEGVRSHNGQEVRAVPVQNPNELLSKIERDTMVVAIDEVQFFDEGIIDVCRRLAESGRRVIVAGLDQDFRGESFGQMAQLLALARDVTKLRAVCEVCRDPALTATRTQRLIGGKPVPYDSPIIQVGGKESYQARCPSCHRVPRNENQLELWEE